MYDTQSTGRACMIDYTTGWLLTQVQGNERERANACDDSTTTWNGFLA